VPSTLAAGDSFEYILTGITAVAGQHSNTAMASGLYNQQTYRNTDMAHYFGYEPKFEIKTDHDQPVNGKVDLPDDAAPRIGGPPANGTATVDEDGNWIYTPNPGFSGRDVFTIIVRKADGAEYEVTIEIMVEEPAVGLTDKLLISTPSTAGDAPLAAIYSLWLMLVASFTLRRGFSGHYKKTAKQRK